MVLLLKQQQNNQQLNSLLSSPLPFSQSSSLHHHAPPSSQLLLPSSPDSSSSSSLKSTMNSQLLCTQALLESHQFKLLAHDSISQFKMTISKLENQLASLNSKIKLELKILQASNLLRTDLNLHDDLDRFPERFKRLYDQKESVQSQLFDLRTLLFQHLSAALALGYKNLEHLLSHPSSNPYHAQLSTSFGLPRSPTPPSAHPSSRSNISTTYTRFAGPHMFASDQTGSSIFSLPYHQNSPEPFHPSSSPRSKSYQADQNHLLQDEITSLRALLKTKDSIISDQSSDIHLLELEVETLQQSLSDPSSNNIQLNRDQSSSKKDSEAQIEALRSQNSELIQALQTSNDHVDTATTQINQLKLQVDQLESELASERSDHGTSKKFNDERIKEAEHRATLTDKSHSELKLNVSNLKAQLETAQQSSRTTRIQAEKLETELQSSRIREAEFQTEIKSIQAQTLSKDQAVIAREAEHKADWDFLIDRLLTLNQHLNADRAKSSKLAKFLLDLSSSHSRLRQVNDRHALSQALVDSLLDYITMVNTQLASAKIENDSSGTNLDDELEKLRQSNNLERSELLIRLKELESHNEELKRRNESQESEQGALNNDSTEMESLKLELANVKQQLAEKESLMLEQANIKQQLADKESTASADRTLRELWKLLPSNLDSRATMNLDNDLTQLKALYESPRKASAAVGLGGLFGLARRAATPTIPEDSEFSVELMLEKVRLVIENDRKLIDRLIKYEAEKDSHKTNSIRAQKLVTESQEALRTYQSQVKELEESLEYANTQSAAMLEKVNDLMESEEKSNMLARRAETNVQKLQSEIEHLQSQLKSLHSSTT